MIPTTYPVNSSGQMVVKEVLPEGLTEWVDYIPVQAVTEVTASAKTTNEDGYMEVVYL